MAILGTGVFGVVATENFNFAPNTKPLTGQITTNGQLIIGASSGQRVRVGTLTPGTGVTITNGPGSITIGVSGTGVGQTISGDTGGPLSPTLGNWNLLSTATNGIETTGAGSTLTIAMASPYADGDFSFESQAGGVTRTLTIQNTVDAASSQARQLIQVAGATSGDPFTTYTIAGVQSFSTGIDNSASDIYKISAGTSLGLTDYFSMSATGNCAIVTSVGTTGLDIVANVASTYLEARVVNNSDTAGADANYTLLVAGDSAGDAQVKYSVGGGSNFWSTGLDNSDSDAYVTSANNGVGTNNVMRAAKTGGITLPLQPRFQARLSATASNVTGDGTAYTIVFNTANFDNRSGLNTGTGVYTAPETQYYIFSGNITVTNLVAANTATLSLITTGNNFLVSDIPIGILRDPSNNYVINFSVGPTLMSATDTASLLLTVAGGAKTVNVLGGTISASGSCFMGAAIA